MAHVSWYTDLAHVSWYTDVYIFDQAPPHCHWPATDALELGPSQEMLIVLQKTFLVAAGAMVGDREALAAPVGGTIFFAGEATHPCVNPCMQSALQTGEHAAAQIVDAAMVKAGRPARVARM